MEHEERIPLSLTRNEIDFLKKLLKQDSSPMAKSTLDYINDISDQMRIILFLEVWEKDLLDYENLSNEQKKLRLSEALFNQIDNIEDWCELYEIY